MSVELVDLTLDNVFEYGICGYKNRKNKGLRRKVDWLKQRFSEGIKIKTIITEKDGSQGLIEYIPGEYCWRPVDAKGYMFIHCIFSGFRKVYKGHGYGSMLIDECINDSKQQNMQGVAVVTRKSGWMADNRIFFKKGFEVVDSATPDFDLLVKKFDADASDPKFKRNWEQNLKQYPDGLTIIWSGQCPYPSNYAEQLAETAEKEFNVTANLVELKTCEQAQNSLCPFGVFCVIYNGKVVAGTPISKGRLRNILKKELKQK